MTMNIEAIVRSIQPQTQPSPAGGFEYGRGWGIYANPFGSGHVLALRVFPENDFVPFKTIWHRTPEEEWTIHVDGPRLDTACPRYYGAAAQNSRFADISLEWTGPMDLTVEMDDPELVWTVSMADSPLVEIVNATGGTVPDFLARTRPLTRLMEWIGDAVFDTGEIDLTGVAPNGQEAILLPRALLPIVSGSAHLDGTDLGTPETHTENPTIGELRLSARPTFVIGRAYFTMQDAAEYERTVAELRGHSTLNEA